MAPGLETWFGACGKQWHDPISLPSVGVALGLNETYQGHIATGCVLLKHPACEGFESPPEMTGVIEVFKNYRACASARF